ncbi:hypothetical protein Tco_0969936 [Tanacetum coccineum]
MHQSLLILQILGDGPEVTVQAFKHSSLFTLGIYEETETEKEKLTLFSFSLIGFLKCPKDSDTRIMEHEPVSWDNSLRICSKDVIKHIKWHGTIAFIFYFLNLIKNHQSEVELSFDGSVVNHVCGACVYMISIAKDAKEIFPKNSSHPLSSGRISSMWSLLGSL